MSPSKLRAMAIGSKGCYDEKHKIGFLAEAFLPDSSVHPVFFLTSHSAVLKPASLKVGDSF